MYKLSVPFIVTDGYVLWKANGAPSVNRIWTTREACEQPATESPNQPILSTGSQRISSVLTSFQPERWCKVLEVIGMFFARLHNFRCISSDAFLK